MKSAACPSCAAAMEQRFFERKPAGKVELDFCFACHAIWFDQYESAALTPFPSAAGTASSPRLSCSSRVRLAMTALHPGRVRA